MFMEGLTYCIVYCARIASAQFRRMAQCSTSTRHRTLYSLTHVCIRQCVTLRSAQRCCAPRIPPRPRPDRLSTASPAPRPAPVHRLPQPRPNTSPRAGCPMSARESGNASCSASARSRAIRLVRYCKKYRGIGGSFWRGVRAFLPGRHIGGCIGRRSCGGRWYVMSCPSPGC